MDELIKTFPDQLRQALAIAESAKLKPANAPRQVLVAGMGGSGIGADLVAALTRPAAPMITIKDYHLPAWAGPETLVIVSSYSGETEETLSVLEQALRQKCRIIGIASDGTVARLAAERNFDHVIVPGGRPPRSTLGFSVVQQLNILHHYGLIRSYAEEVRHVADFLEERQQTIRANAVKLSKELLNSTPVLYGASDWEAVLRRWCQQIQENGKMLCWMNVFPELNHNELVGWRDLREDLSVLFFTSPLDHPRTARRIAITRSVVSNCCERVFVIEAEGSDRWEQTFFWVHSGDWLSVELASLRQVDPVEIAVIDRLKVELAKLP